MAKTNEALHNALDSKINDMLDNGHILPVVVTGGRKFKGKGWIFDMYETEDSFRPVYWSSGHCFMIRDGYGSVTAKIWDPVANKIQYASYKFCELDESISAEETEAFEKALKQNIVDETLSYCHSKSNESETNIRLFARRCLAKRYCKAFIDPEKAIPISKEDLIDRNLDFVSRTIDWALQLKHHRQAKIEQIIDRALYKRNIDYRDYEALFSLKFSIFGWTKFKYLNFAKDDSEAEH